MTNTIALVDDDRNILTSVSMALEAEGFAVRCYSDGAEALKGMTAQPVASRVSSASGTESVTLRILLSSMRTWCFANCSTWF